MTKCSNCNKSLYLSDVESNTWHTEFEQFVLSCSFCGEKNFIDVNLFDENRHITKFNLEMLKKEKRYLPDQQMQLISEHLQNCNPCSEALNCCILNEIETRLRFNEKTLNFFMNNSKEVFREISEAKWHLNGTDIKIDAFKLNDKEFSIKDEDIFFKDKVRICYYLRLDSCLAGLASFLNSSDKIILERIWTRSEASIKKEQNFFQDLKDKKIKLDLETLETIFTRIR